MSQGFRKSSKLAEPTDTTGITPPTRVDEQRNSRRTQQIAHLHQEFQDLKTKIKEVENKNQKIIQKIHKSYNFKKKNGYTEDYIKSPDTSPVVHYENSKYDVGFSGALSVDAHSNKSDQSDKQLKLQKRSTEFGSRKSNKNQKFNFSVEYGKNEQNVSDMYDQERASRQGYSNQAQMRYTGTPIPPMYPQTSPTFSTVGSQHRFDRKLVEEISQQKQILEQELSEKESEVYKLQSSLKSNVRNLKVLFQTSLQEFEQEVFQKNMVKIEKTLKKYDQKLRKLALGLKDKQEDKKSSRLLEYGKQRRSQSKSRRTSPPRDPSHSYSYTNFRDSKVGFTTDPKDESRSRTRIAQQQQQKNKKEFQEIAAKYEQIIKAKTQQLQKCDKRYKLKQRQCYQLKMRVDIFQKRLSQYENDKKSSTSGADSSSREGQKRMSDSYLLEDINNHESVDSVLRQQQIQRLNTKLQELSTISNQKSTQISNLQNSISLLENKIRTINTQNQQNLSKAKSKYEQQKQKVKKQLQRLLNEKQNELQQYRAKLLSSDKKYLDKECQFYSLESKIKKLQGLVSNKDMKIDELQKIVGQNMSGDRSMLTSSQILSENPNNSYLDTIRKLKQEIESLENKGDESQNQIFGLTKKVNFFKTKNEQLQNQNNQLKKQIQTLQVENEQLKINVNMNNISAVMKQQHSEDNLNEEDIGHNTSNIGTEQKKNLYEIQNLNAKIKELNKQKQQWYEKYQKTKNSNLQKESESIKIKSQLSFMQKQQADYQTLITRLKSENDILKRENKQYQAKLSETEQKLQLQRQDFKIQLSDIEVRWAEFEQDMRKSGYHNDREGERSQRSSMFSSKTSRANRFDNMNTQNQYLTLKLKEAEAEIEALKTMQKRVIDEYQSMAEEHKIQSRNKGDHIKRLKQDIQDLNSKLMNTNMRLQMSKNDGLTNNIRKQQQNQLLQRIQQLQAQLKQAKQINNKLTDMQGQLFDQLKLKEQQSQQLYDELNKKQSRIQQLQQIVQIKGEPVNTYASHLSQSTHKRQSIKSQSSLKYSSHSQLRKSRMLNSSKIGEQKVFDLELSEAGSEFYDQPSQISNISELFEKDELPYQKIKIKRHEQIKLFEKTASYIKSLKKSIEQKNKKIKLLEKKIESLKSSELVRKELGLDIELKEQRFAGGRLQSDDIYKDYESEQCDYRRGGNLGKFKKLEHDTNLVVEENTMLLQQIQTLEEELIKAEEQQNSLVKIKDLYKEEIKKLMKKNEEQTAKFEQELQNQKKRVQECESVHNIQAVKQLFSKTIEVTGLVMKQQNLSSNKKQQKRKQLQQYIRVISNILKMNKKERETVLGSIQK